MQDILEMLNAYDHFNVCEEIEIAKGKYKKPYSIREGFNKFKRALKCL